MIEAPAAAIPLLEAMTVDDFCAVQLTRIRVIADHQQCVRRNNPLACSGLHHRRPGLLWRFRETTVFLSAVAANWLFQIGLAAGDLLIGDASQAGSYVDTALPLGISFYSLQALAYHLDVSQGTSQPARSFPVFFLFKAFFHSSLPGRLFAPTKSCRRFSTSSTGARGASSRWV